MNLKPFLYYTPYVFLLLANFIYIYANGLQPLGSDPKLFLYNLIFFILIGTVIIIKLNLLLHSWFIKQQGDVKQKTKVAIKKAKQLFNFVVSIFRNGNQKMMIKIFFFLQLSIFINKLIPGVLLGILVGTYFQYKGFIEEKFKKQIQQFKKLTEKSIQQFMDLVPKYQKTSKDLQ